MHTSATLSASINFVDTTMPYIIAVLIMVLASVGFTFFKVSDNTVVADNSAPIVVSSVTTEAARVTSTSPQAEFASTTGVAEAIPEATTAHPVTVPLPSSGTPTPTPSPTPTPTPIPTPSPTPAPVVLNDYKNGTYSTRSTYRTPGGTYTMNFSATISNDTISNTSLSIDPGSDSYSKRFINSYQSTVIGQDLGSVHPSRIGGASLTTRAFNTALDTIRQQAAT